MRLISLSTIFTLFFFVVAAQEQDSIVVSAKKNTIRWDPTVMALGPGSIVLGYERIVNSGQSFSINVGSLIKAPFKNKEGENIHLLEEHNRGGFLVSADYRFYLKKRNKFPAPDGLYWGPYFSIYDLWFEGSSEILENNVSVNTIYFKTEIAAINIGVQLGYQFVIKNRITIDLILVGPSFSNYKAKINFDSDIDLDESGKFYDDMKKFLEFIYPGLSSILNNHEFTTTGRLNFNYYGFRYFFQIGYRF